MPASTLTFVYQTIKQNIPSEILQLAFRPQQFNTTIENRIRREVIEAVVCLDVNLVGGKRRDIIMDEGWRLRVPNADQYNVLGSGIQGAFYLIPQEAREYANIASVLGLAPSMDVTLPGSLENVNGQGMMGNTIMGMASQMLNTRTFAQSPMVSRVTLEGTNIVCFYPEQFVNGIVISVMLEYDSEFRNMNQSSIFAMRNLCLCAVQRYIANRLIIQIDETEIVGGMELGRVKQIVDEYLQKGDQYQELLMKAKGAMAYDPRTLSQIISRAL